MTSPAEVMRQIEMCGYVVVPGLLSQQILTTARDEISALLAAADWGSGFDGSRTRRVWALLARTRCMDQAALNPLVLEVVEQVIGPGAQFSLTYATQVHPRQDAQTLHYEQGIYPLPRDRDVMVTAIWALDDFTARNGATLVIPRSHTHAEGKPRTTMPSPWRCQPAPCCYFPAAYGTAPAPTPAPGHGSGSSSTTHSRGCAHARRTHSAPTQTRSACCRNDSRNYSASTSHPPTSDSSTAGTRANGS
jgi:phytanoyl-CoA dioxygenase PhyH